MALRWSSSCILTPCIPVHWIGLNKASVNTDWWRKASSADTFLCAFTGCCNAYSNDFKSIYPGPSFAYVPLDHNQSRLGLPTRFLHQLHATLPASARVLSVLKKLASVFTDVIRILTMIEGGNVNYERKKWNPNKSGASFYFQVWSSGALVLPLYFALSVISL